MWKNWAGDQACTPAAVVRPSAVEAVQEAVRNAAGQGSGIRVVGAGHSFGDNVLTSGTLMSLDSLTGLLGVDATAGTVRVAAGTRLHELNQLLDARGLALANLGDIDSQSVAGAISTGTHGTGRTLGNLATFVEDVELVTADGDVVQASEAGAGVLEAARLAVGSLGVVTAYTLKILPAYTLRCEQEPAPLADVLERLDSEVDANRHFEFFSFPHSDTVIAKRTNRVENVPVGRAAGQDTVTGPAAVAGKVKAYLEEELLENTALDLVCRLGRARRSLIPRLNRLATDLVSPTVRTGRSHEVLVTRRSVRFTETEWALPREAGAEALKEMRRVVTARGLDVNFPFEVRFVAADEQSFLSPAYGRDSCYIAAHMYRGMPWQEFFGAVQDVALAYGGRPHWGKRHTLSADRLAGLYPRWEEFQDARRRLDPHGLFSNDHTRRIFGA
ncbi:MULTISPECIES: D-arabinono-1,4-lactone oxidase [Arthrobacter]|uniref:D-arabinono-1,4-lactone oxidase n=2 Tax=Arthrobacter TaxID=1663 RepID=A0ABU9KHH9_9MICC|nr:D-arabinono-1,4-lactone oxidase [Arthrobacter sp. YJM1]MDP5226653.1 D-arabinono-1,4-lactone oxidase [Arthrobacter sp. YJM1]